MRFFDEKLYEYEELEMIKGLTFYHGTSDVFEMERILPSTDTGNLREDFRKKFRNKVFVTTSLLSAKKYALKACDIYGGNPVVYSVTPDFDSIFNTNQNEYICDFADIKNIID